jgi:uncharacterized protein (DUF1800 family)
MLVHSAFYTDQVKSGLVRAPVDYTVALLDATGQRSAIVNAIWLMNSMGQRPLYPPNVSGWRPNGYWVNASAMEGRARTAQSFVWAATRTYWQQGGAGVMSLRNGSLTNAQVTANNAGVPTLSNADFIGLLEEHMGLELSDASLAEILRYTNGVTVWERNGALLLMMLATEMHVG